MERIPLKISPVLLLLLTNSVLALDLDYYTYGGFSETVLAFQRVSLLFNHGNYGPMIFIAAAFGLFWGGSMFFVKSLTEQNGGFPLQFLMVPFLGVALYQGVILPKGTMHIYDPTRNAYEAVGNVPDLVIFLAGGWNKFERMAADIESSSSAYPYDEAAGGIGFNLLFNVSTSRNDYTEHYLTKSVKSFYKDCSEIPLVVTSSGFDLETLKSGTNDIYTYLDNIAWSSTSTTYYDIANKNGIALTCREAWIDNLRPALAVTSLYDRPLTRICESTGFNPSQSVQLNACQTLMDDLGINMFEVNAGHISLMRNALISQVIAEAMAEENPDVATRIMTNRDMMTDGIGAAINSQEWVMTFRSIMLTIVLGLIPFLAVFMVTPLAFKSLFLISGLFAWAAIWGIVDVISNGIAIDQSFRVMEEIRTHALGLEAFIAAPTDAMKAMTIFGKIRGYGALISTIVTGSLFGFSGFALSSMAGSWQQSLEKSGTESADKSINPEERGQQYNAMTQGYATESNVTRMGYSSAAASAAYRQGSESMASMMESNLLQNDGMDQGGAIAATASARAGESYGSTSAVMQASGVGSPEGFNMGGGTSGAMASMAANASNMQRTMNLANNEGIVRAARMSGMSIQDTANNSGFMSQLNSVNDSNVLDGMSGKDVLSGYYGNGMASINGGRIMDEVGSNYNGGKPQFFEDLAANKFGRDFANFTTASMLAEKLNTGVFESSVQMGSTGFSVMVTPDNYNDLVSGGLISPAQQTTLANDNYTGRLDFSYHTPTESLGDTTASSGARGVSNNNVVSTSAEVRDLSTRVDSSYRNDASTSINSSYNEDRGFNVQAQTVQRVSLNPEMQSELSNVLRLADDRSETTSPEELQLDKGMADTMSSVINKSITDLDASRLTGNIGGSIRAGAHAQTGISILGSGGSVYADASINAGLDQSWSTTEQDTEQYNSNLNEARMIRETSIEEGRIQAHQEVLRRNEEAINSGDIPMSVDQMESLKEELTYTYAAQNYHSQASNWFDSALEKNKSESSELNSEKIDEKLAELKENTTEEEQRKNPGESRRERRMTRN